MEGRIEERETGERRKGEKRRRRQRILNPICTPRVSLADPRPRYFRGAFLASSPLSFSPCTKGYYDPLSHS